MSTLIQDAFKRLAKKMKEQFLKANNEGDDINIGEIEEVRQQIQSLVDAFFEGRKVYNGQN